MFGSNLPMLAKSRQVIAVHLQGHGHTKDIDRPLRFEFMADDHQRIAARSALCGGKLGEPAAQDLRYGITAFRLVGTGEADQVTYRTDLCRR
jgi:hypothetical protein